MAFHYQESLALDQLAVLDASAFQADILRHVAQGWRLVCLCGLPATALHSSQNAPDAPAAGLLAVLAHDATGMLHALSTPPLNSYPALTLACPQAHLFEREIYEQWGILPEGHPWLKPVRYCPPLVPPPHTGTDSAAGAWQRPLPGVTDQFTVQGPQVHEVAVGPVHAGVIEPGHFRFQCYGENVMHLEISLGFQHRGIEKKLLGGPDARTVYLMECVAGDSTIAHTSAYCTLLEVFTRRPATARGQALRRIALELERLANHTGDMGALAGDVGFLPTSSWCGRIRGDFLNMTALLCGNRFGRGLVRRGGTALDLNSEIATTLSERLQAAHRDMQGATDAMFGAASVLDRFEGTGTVSRTAAQDIGLVGVAAKASGLLRDARAYYPYGGPAMEVQHICSCNTGDVYARAKVRRDEADASVARIRAELDALPAGPACHDEISSLPPQRLAVSFVEGWRGTVCHVAVTTAEGLFSVYKTIDPSFHNWLGLALALRDEQISDFPLCNKSFNLSYCGHDL